MESSVAVHVLGKGDGPAPSSSLKEPSKLLSTVTATSSDSTSPALFSLPAKMQAPMANASSGLSSSAGVSGVVLVTAQHSSTLPNPPPLVSVSNVPSGTQRLGGNSAAGSESTPGLALLGKLTQNAVAAQAPGVEVAQVAPSVGTSSGVKNSAGGLGAGKPKAFLALMTSTSKKQSKKTPPGATKTSKGPGNKTKAPLLNSTLSKKGDPAPSRTSNRSIKRPRTYDEECDDLKAMKPVPGKKLKGTPKASKSVGKKQSSAGIKDLGRWRPTDDLMLISAVQQTNDLTAVHLGVNFSCRFTLQEVEERWHALLYSPPISQLAIEAMKALHPGVVTMALNNALWSQEEEAVLARIPTTDPGHLEKFQAVLKENPAVFHTCRTATSLHHHWVLMGHNGLLNNQKVDLIPPEENIKEFADAEDRLEDSELMKPKDVREAALEQELVSSDRLAKMEILKLEEEIPLWRTVIDTASPPDFGPNDFALLKGKVVEFRMAKRTVVIGRSTSISDVDFDLSLEGPAFKISRRQASIQLTDSGEFMLHNEGRRPMYVSGKAVVSKTSAKLLHNQILEVASMSFLVLLNTKLATAVKNFTHSITTSIVTHNGTPGKRTNLLT